jgi:hypothetical protein
MLRIYADQTRIEIRDDPPHPRHPRSRGSRFADIAGNDLAVAMAAAPDSQAERGQTQERQHKAS